MELTRESAKEMAQQIEEILDENIENADQIVNFQVECDHKDIRIHADFFDTSDDDTPTREDVESRYYLIQRKYGEFPFSGEEWEYEEVDDARRD